MLKEGLGKATQIYSGAEGLVKLATLPAADIVLIAIVGTTLKITATQQLSRDKLVPFAEFVRIFDLEPHEHLQHKV